MTATYRHRAVVRPWRVEHWSVADSDMSTPTEALFIVRSPRIMDIVACAVMAETLSMAPVLAAAVPAAIVVLLGGSGKRSKREERALAILQRAMAAKGAGA